MTDYDKLTQLVKEVGMDAKWSKMFIKKLADDEKAFPADDAVKAWALSRGFYPGRVELYGLTEENYRDYLPDYSYFMIHPINHHFKIWVNDKLSLKYVLNSNGCQDTMPEYYLYVENNGNYTYLMDAPEYINRDKDFIINLLKDKGTLAVKPNSGTSGGKGFMKLVYKDGVYFENNKRVEKEALEETLQNLGNHIVTEYAYQHSDLAAIWPESECTLRIIMVKLPYKTPYTPEGWQCVVSYARFGTSISGGASNLSSGGIGIGFDFETGRFNEEGIRYRRFCQDGQWKCTEHPDTHVMWANTKLPLWSFVKEKIYQVCDHIHSLDYLGFDVIITPSGLKFCEINTHPAADYEQIMCGPILADENARSFYSAHGIDSVDTKQFYELYLRSQI